MTKKELKEQEKDNRAKEQARSQLNSITERVETLKKAEEKENYNAIEEARQAIEEDALSVEVCTDWHAPGSEDNKPTEYRILLCWGGTACQIVGALSHGQPETATIQYQDWFTEWTCLEPEEGEEEIMLEYARCFFSWV